MKTSLLALVLLLIPGLALAETEQNMKGWMLFSWLNRNNWYFALLPGTNRSKQWSELNLAKVQGWDALRTKLANLSQGEEIVFANSTHVGDTSPELPKLVLPSSNIQKKIATFAKTHGLKVTK